FSVLVRIGELGAVDERASVMDGDEIVIRRALPRAFFQHLVLDTARKDGDAFFALVVIEKRLTGGAVLLGLVLQFPLLGGDRLVPQFRDGGAELLLADLRRGSGQRFSKSGDVRVEVHRRVLVFEARSELEAETEALAVFGVVAELLVV